MRIAVIGAGAIGGLIAGYLKLKGEDVTLLGRAESVLAIKASGLKISGVRGDFNVKIDTLCCLNFNPELVILATKTQDVLAAIKDNLEHIRDAAILTTQNGIQADNLVAEYLPAKNIISSIVMFGATHLHPGHIVHNFEGDWVIGRFFDSKPDEREINLSLVLDKIFPVVISEDIKGMKYLKIFVNANNCIPAILGMSMQEAFSDVELSRISVSIWKEGFKIISKAGIKLVSLPGFPIENVTRLTSLPGGDAAMIFCQIMTKMGKDPVYGSILQSIKRGKASEIDYINGEFIRIARENGLAAPVNEKVVDLVHRVERERKFLTKEALFGEMAGLVNRQANG